MLDHSRTRNAAPRRERSGLGRFLRRVARVLPGRRSRDGDAPPAADREPEARQAHAPSAPLGGPFSAGGPFGIDPSRPRGGGLVPLDQGAVERLVTVIKQSGVHATAGKIQLVHLDELRRRFRPQWPELAEAAMQIAEFVLRHRLEPSDIFTRYENYAFIVVFSMIDQSVAERRAEAIRKEILDILMADPRFAKVLDVLAVAAPLLEFVDDEGTITLAKIDAGLDAASGKAVEAPRPRDLPDWLSAYQTIYRPIVAARSRTVSCHIALPKGTLLAGTEVVGARVYPVQTAGVLTLQLDRRLIADALAALKQTIAAGREGMIASLVSMHSLLDPKRELIARLTAMSEEERARFAIEIVGLAPSVPTAHVVGAVGELRRYAAQVVLRVGLMEGNFARLRDLGLHGVVCNLGDGGAARLPVGQQHAAILDFVGRAKAAGLMTLCFGLTSESLIKTARNAGADYLAGDAVAGFVSEPGSRRPLAAAI